MPVSNSKFWVSGGGRTKREGNAVPSWKKQVFTSALTCLANLKAESNVKEIEIISMYKYVHYNIVYNNIYIRYISVKMKEYYKK